MKSKFALLVLLTGAVFAVAACGGSTDTTNNSGTSNQCASPEAGTNADNTNKDSGTTTVAKYDVGVEGMT